MVGPPTELPNDKGYVERRRGFGPAVAETDDASTTFAGTDDNVLIGPGT